MDMIGYLAVAALVALIPIALLIGLIGLGVFVWSWKRIGPYFVDFGRWIGNWRNYIPCGCLLFGLVIFLLLVAAVLPQQLDILRILLLVVVAVIFFFVTMFAVIIWSVRLSRWLWSHFRQSFWEYLERLWNLLWKGISAEGRAASRRPARAAHRPSGDVASKKPTGEAAGQPAEVARTAAKTAPSGRRSTANVSWLWGLVWGKPEKGARLPKEAGKRRVERVRPAVPAEAMEPPRMAGRAKPGLRPLIWRLGLLGKPRRPDGKPKPAATKGTVESPGKPLAPMPPTDNQSRPSVTAAAAKPAESKPKPSIVLGPKPKRSLPGPIGRLGRSVGGALEGLRKGFWAGAFWVGRKARGGMDSLLRLLHLGGKRS